MAISFDVITGQVFIRNFDQAVIETLGGYVDVVGTINSGNAFPSGVTGSGSGTQTGACRKSYFIDIPAAIPSQVPVTFSKPFATFNEKFLPMFVVARTTVVPAMTRWHSTGAMQYRAPSANAIHEHVILANGDVVSGWSEYEQLPQAMPFDLSYTITAMSRYEHEAIAMLKKVLSIYKPYSRILLKDSLNALRTYTVFNESGFTDNSELLDITNRTKSYAVEIRIEGELDLSDPETNSTVLEIIERTSLL
jgi:hypothetical protein